MLFIPAQNLNTSIIMSPQPVRNVLKNLLPATIRSTSFSSQATATAASFHQKDERPRMLFGSLKEVDPEISGLIEKEKERQFTGLELIASEVTFYCLAQVVHIW